MDGNRKWACASVIGESEEDEEVCSPGYVRACLRTRKRPSLRLSFLFAVAHRARAIGHVTSNRWGCD